MKPEKLFIISLIFLLNSCEFIHQENVTDNDLTLQPEESFITGRICGWCGGSDSLVIEKNTMFYKKTNFCNDTVITESFPTDTEIWNKLNNLLDYAKFSSFEHSSCAVCVDGCDTWIQIENNTNSHHIQYVSFQYSEVAPIKDLAILLDSLLMEIQNPKD